MSAERRSVLGLLAVLVALSLPALLDPGAVGRGADLLDVAMSAHPYRPSTHAVLLYLWIPVVTLSSLVLVMAPGLVLVHAAGAARNAAEWLLLSLAATVVALSVAIETIEAAIGGPVRGAGFALAALATTVVLTLAALRLARPGRTLLRLDRAGAHTLAAAAAGALVLFVGLEPKFLWETFNGDGAHAYESARMLLHRAAPFWSPEAGAMHTYPGVTSFLLSYPMSWFIRLFGEREVSARVPLLLFNSAGLYAGLLALIEFGRDATAARVRWLLWTGLAVFTVVMSFSATYNPYHADIALPATQDALVIAWFLGFAWAFLSERYAWMTAFAGLTFATSPAGQVLLGLWVVAAALFLRPTPRRSLALAVGAVAGWFLVAKVSPALLGVLGLAVPGTEHSTGSLAARLLHVQWREWQRAAYFILPGGILPALAVAAVWRQDRVARTVAAVAAAQFAFFYFQSRVSLHYFAPGMVLPLVVFWRIAPDLGRTRLVSLAVVAAAAVALVVSLPADPGPQLAARPVGAAIDDRIGGYDTSAPETFQRSELLTALIPKDANHAVPDSSYGGSPLSWFYYAHRPPPGPRAVAYVLQPGSAPPVPGRLAEARNGVALYVVDEAALARNRARRPPNSIAWIYRISKYTLFHGS